jgi:hypothetical protein
MKVYLDDIRDAPEGWVLVRNVPKLIKLICNESVTNLSLDHDLGEGEMSGYDFMRWLEAEVFFHRINSIPKITFHTANPVGRNNMEKVLNSIERILFKKG